MYYISLIHIEDIVLSDEQLASNVPEGFHVTHHTRSK